MPLEDQEVVTGGGPLPLAPAVAAAVASPPNTTDAERDGTRHTSGHATPHAVQPRSAQMPTGGGAKTPRVGAPKRSGGPIQVNLNPIDKGRVTKLERIAVGGIKMVFPRVTVEAAKAAKLPLPLACAILAQETAGGHNEWGHDPSIFTGGYDALHHKQWPEQPVTKAAYLTYRSERGRENAYGAAPRQQGVGPAQLTTAKYQDAADKLGGAWKPLPNMVEGFTLLRQSIQRSGLRATIVAYNGSGPRAEQYADQVLANEKKWARALGMSSMQH